MDPLVPPAHSPQRPKRTPRARGFRLLLVALPVGVLAYLLMTPAAIRVYGPYLSRSVFETLAYADVIILSYAVGYTVAALVPVVTGKTLEEASHDWDQLDGAEERPRELAGRCESEHLTERERDRDVGRGERSRGLQPCGETRHAGRVAAPTLALVIGGCLGYARGPPDPPPGRYP